jgi:hypothetical protein
VSIIVPDSKNYENVTTLSPAFKKDASGKVTKVLAEMSQYQPNEKERFRRQEIIKAFTYGHLTMFKPRREFNDLSLISRLTVDKMSFNTYQPNDGDAVEGDELNTWKSRAVKPIVRNKIMSIAAHVTAQLLFPKVFAYNDQNEEEQDAAIVLEDLMEWTGDRSDYSKVFLYAVITALYSPASIVDLDYVETYRKVKVAKKEDGTYETADILDEDLSGFINSVVPVDELYIENFYESDIQKQGWLLRRKVQSYSLLKAKYENKYENFKYVKPGVQVVYNDANQTFYDVYDTNLRQEMGEELTWWRKSDDIKIVMVNGVMMTDADNANPRNDKRYPFAKFGYQPLDEGRCFYYKSLAFALGPEAKIINTLYPMIIDGTYLNLMPPMVNIGGEVIASDVIIPGAVTTLSDVNADLRPLTLGTNLRAGMETIMKVEDSVNSFSIEPVQQGAQQPTNQTAYEVFRQESNAKTVLGLFVKMIAEGVKAFGKLRLGDILQYLTIPEVSDIEGNPQLVYKTFYLYDKMARGKSKTRKIKFDLNMPEGMITPKELKAESYKVLEEQGGPESKTEIYKVNPTLIRKLKYFVVITPDILNPLSADLNKAYRLEEYDRMIQNPLADQEEAYRFLLGAYSETKRDPDKFIAKPQGEMGMPSIPSSLANQPNVGALQAVMGQGKTPPTPTASGVPIR